MNKNEYRGARELVSARQLECDEVARKQWRAVRVASVFVAAFSYQLMFVLQAVWR